MLDGETIRWIWPSVPDTCEPGHCLDERALSSSPNEDVFFLKCCWNDLIRLRNNRHWSFASTESNRYELYRVHPKNYSHHLSGRLCVCLFWSWLHPMKSIVLTILSSRVWSVDSCFVHNNESTQKFIWIIVETSPNIVLKSSHGRAYGSQWANAAPILPIAFSYPIVRAKLKSLCHDMSVASTSSRTFTRQSIKTISWILSMISSVAVSIGCPERGASHLRMYDHV